MSDAGGGTGPAWRDTAAGRVRAEEGVRSISRAQSSPMVQRGGPGADPSVSAKGGARGSSRLARCELCICHTCGPVVQ